MPIKILRKFRNVSKYDKIIWGVLIISILYNLFISGHYYIVNHEQQELEYKLINHASDMSHNQIKAIERKIAGNLWILDKLAVYSVTFLMLNGILIIVILIRNWNNIKDRRKIKNKIPFESLLLGEQKNKISNAFCKNCGEYVESNFKEEKILLGTPYIIVTCKKCNTELKIKDTW